jgi:hypothetical protein
VSSGGLRIALQGDEAAYPVIVSALITAPVWTAEGNQEGANFGHSVASAGDVNGDGFGDVIVGADFYDNGQTREGRVFLYLGSAQGLSDIAAWTYESDQSGANLGHVVETAGDVNGDGYSDVIVSAYFYDVDFPNEGRAFVFHGSATGLPDTPDWTAESGQTDAYFGSRLGTAGDVDGDGFSDVIVGSILFDNGEEDEGGAFVFHGSADGLSTTPDWMTEGDQAFAGHGVDVATAGDVNGDGYGDVLVGSLAYTNGESGEGRAQLYLGSPGGLSATADWASEGNQAGAAHGASVATAGDVNGDGYSDLVLGAAGYDNGEENEGRIYVYYGSAGGPSLEPDWSAESDQAFAELGFPVATAGDVNGDGYADMVAGAYHYDDGETDEGAAFVFLGSAEGLATTPASILQGNQDSAEFGIIVATGGDVNGDGFSEIVVGAHLFDAGETDEGRVFLFPGSSAGLEEAPSWSSSPAQAVARFGSSVAAAGDVNGDGFADVIVGAPWFDNGENEEGRALVYLGTESGPQSIPHWVTESDQVGAELGSSVASAGDVNGDGFGDVIVGAPAFDDGEQDEGSAFVFHGSAKGLAASSSWSTASNVTESAYGASVASAGDVNGDGFGDVVIGAPKWSDDQDREGLTAVYHGSAAGLQTIPSWTLDAARRPGARRARPIDRLGRRRERRRLFGSRRRRPGLLERRGAGRSGLRLSRLVRRARDIGRLDRGGSASLGRFRHLGRRGPRRERRRPRGSGRWRARVRRPGRRGGSRARLPRLGRGVVRGGRLVRRGRQDRARRDSPRPVRGRRGGCERRRLRRSHRRRAARGFRRGQRRTGRGVPRIGGRPVHDRGLVGRRGGPRGARRIVGRDGG